ncbi:hypothetical protein JCM14076_14020 [Methylosoma difficile]
MFKKLQPAWQLLRQMSGDDAYERYLQHFAEHHQDEGSEPLSRKAYFKQQLDSKWNGINRCC